MDSRVIAVHMHRYLSLIKQFKIHSLNTNKSLWCFTIVPLNLTKNSNSYPSENLSVFLTLGDWLLILEVFLPAFLVFQLTHHIPDKIKRTGLIWICQRPTQLFMPPNGRPGTHPCPGHIYKCLSLRLGQGSGMAVTGEKLQCEPGIKTGGGGMKKNSNYHFLCISRSLAWGNHCRSYT